MVGLGLPCFGATLKGVVTNSDGMAVSKARVLVVHDMALVLAQRRNTDFDGRFHFELDPGPYRIFILKRGFRPAFSSILILDEQEEINLDQILDTESENTADKNEDRATRLKEVFRGSNLNPLHQVDVPLYIRASLAPRETTGFVGSVRTGSRRDLDGSLERLSAVEVRTRLGSSVSLTSSLATEARDHGDDATRIRAEMDMQTSALGLAVEAEAIQGTYDDAYSRRAVVKVGYGDMVRLKTGVGATATRLPDAEQRQLRLTQEVHYGLGLHQLAHQVALSDWRDGESGFARRAVLHTDWQHEALKWFAVSLDHDALELVNQPAAHDTHVWLKADNGAQPVKVSAAVGYQSDGHQDSWVQRHGIAGQVGPVSVQLNYRNDRDYRPLTSGDVYGSYLHTPMAPHALESFVAMHHTGFGLEMGLEHGAGLSSRLDWRRADDTGEVLFAPVAGVFLAAAGRREDRISYGLRSSYLDAGLTYTYSDNSGDNGAYIRQALAYRQALAPFRNKAMGLSVELSVQDNPNLPAWWLLAELPRSFDNNEHWYEGHLAFQF